MTPQKLNLIIYQGATFRQSFRWTTQTGSTTTAVDLTNCIVRMQVRKTIKETVKLVDASTTNGKITLIDADDGQFEIELTDEETALLDFNTGVYDLEIEFPSGDVVRLLYGNVALSKEVTR